MCSEKNCITEKCTTQFRKGHNSEPEKEEGERKSGWVGGREGERRRWGEGGREEEDWRKCSTPCVEPGCPSWKEGWETAGESRGVGQQRMRRRHSREGSAGLAQ